MKPTQYNPSPLEVEFTNAIAALRDDLEKKLTNMKVDKVETTLNRDNPHVLFNLTEADGTKHEIIVKCIQRVLED